MEIQTLDISKFYSDDPAQQAAFSQDLAKSFKDIGFVIIKGHNIDWEFQKTAYAKIQEFYDLPTETKKKYHVPGIGGARGYTPFGEEHAKGSKVGDLKEFFHVGVEVPEGNVLKEKYPENVSVKDVEGFDETLRELYSRLNTLGMDLLRAIAMSLDLDREYFTKYVEYGNSILRPIHYPPIPADAELNAIRAGAHEDINLITLLIGASNPGLQAKHTNGEWIPVQSKPDEIVINVGDMLQRLTNYHFVSTTHQVVNPTDDAKAREPRLSVPFFLHPVSDMSLKALPQCVSEENPQKDPDTTAGEYLNERLREIGLIK